MNQKGFGMTEVIAFLFVIMLSLIIVAISYRKIMSNNKLMDHTFTPEVTNYKTPVPTLDVTSYQALENLIAEKSKDYFEHNSQDVKIDYVPLQTLIQNEYIGNVNAVDDENVDCTGYVEYLKINERYKTYLSCGEYYQTSGYDALKEITE